jgi:o-succinylbenzoate synthase
MSVGVTTRSGYRVDVFQLEMSVRFRGIEGRDGVLIRGPAGVAEFSPFWDYDTRESAPWLAAALEAAEQPYPEPLRDRIPVNCTVPAVGPDRAAAVVAGSGGCRTAKVKVAEPGQHIEDDVARVAGVRAALGPAGRIRVDANGGWTVSEAVQALAALAEFGIEYAEQPCATIDELVEVRRRTDVLIAADESIRWARDPFAVRDVGAADIAVLKVQPLGGVRACLRIAEEIAMPVVVSSALESTIGIGAGVALAAALPELPYACGLASTAMFGSDVSAEPFLPVDGYLDVRRPTIDNSLLSAAAAESRIRDKWIDRLRTCEQLLDAGRPRETAR